MKLCCTNLRRIPAKGMFAPVVVALAMLMGGVGCEQVAGGADQAFSTPEGAARAAVAAVVRVQLDCGRTTGFLIAHEGTIFAVAPVGSITPGPEQACNFNSVTIAIRGAARLRMGVVEHYDASTGLAVIGFGLPAARQDVDGLQALIVSERARVPVKRMVVPEVNSDAADVAGVGLRHAVVTSAAAGSLRVEMAGTSPPVGMPVLDAATLQVVGVVGTTETGPEVMGASSPAGNPVLPIRELWRILDAEKGLHNSPERAARSSRAYSATASDGEKLEKGQPANMPAEGLKGAAGPEKGLPASKPAKGSTEAAAAEKNWLGYGFESMLVRAATLTPAVYVAFVIVLNLIALQPAALLLYAPIAWLLWEMGNALYSLQLFVTASRIFPIITTAVVLAFGVLVVAHLLVHGALALYLFGAQISPPRSRAIRHVSAMLFRPWVCIPLSTVFLFGAWALLSYLLLWDAGK